MRTKKLYQQNVYMKEVMATITDIYSKDESTFIILDQTIFFPIGGGQSCDTGFIDTFRVSNVYEEAGEIIHQLSDNCLDESLQKGAKVKLSIDWDKRFDNMQRHCGEHIVSGIFNQMYGGVNRGFHMGDDYMTIDISLEKKPEYTQVSWDMAKEVEIAANKAIWQNLPVSVVHYDTREEAKNVPLRKPLDFDEDITIVFIGSKEDPLDCVACCGTHPAFTGAIGLIKIYKIEVNKGMYRIFLEAGQRAFRSYQARFDVLTTLENSLSAGFDDVIQKYTANQEKNRDVRNQLYQLKKLIISQEISSIKESMCSFLVKEYDSLSLDDLNSIGRGLIGSIPSLLFLVHQDTNTIMIFSNGNDKYDCGRLVKENISIYGGKGGGNKNSARAIFAKAEYVDTFIDLLKKHLSD